MAALPTWLLFACLVPGEMGDAPPTVAEAAPPAALHLGMTATEALQVMGKRPVHVARQIFYHHWREQWIYHTPSSLRLIFDWRRGQEPRLASIRSADHGP